MSLKKLIFHPFARKFFAGEALDDAVARVRTVNAQGLSSTLDFLGEDVMDKGEVENAFREYSRALEAIAVNRLDASLALKLTHIGLDIGRGIAERNALALMELAHGLGVFLWIDMEGSHHTDDTIGIYRRLLKSRPGEVGVALQASLRRTWADLQGLVLDGAKVRLVKGAYNEPHEKALLGMPEIRAQFMGMMSYLLKNAGDFAIGTHDRGLIQAGLAMSIGRHGHFEFQMLMGMRDDLKRSLAKKGVRVVEYVPYGPDWYGYGVRRLKEKRRNALYFAQGLIGR
jgi:proline dehydrogenase